MGASSGRAVDALEAVLNAASVSTADIKTLRSYLQSRSDDGDAPTAAPYKSRSGSIVDVLEDMKEAAESQLSDLRKAENNSRHNFEMVRQSLNDKVRADQKDMADEKAAAASALESKATAENDLQVSQKELADANDRIADTKRTCTQAAADHDATVTSRQEELDAIAKAKQILQESSAGAVSQTYSFLQRSSRGSSHVVVALRELAKKFKSSALTQLASRATSELRFGASSNDPFGKVKGLITD